MTKREATPAGVDFKTLLLLDEGGFRAVLQEALQTVLAAEMTEALQKSERTDGWLGYRSGYYERAAGLVKAVLHRAAGRGARQARKALIVAGFPRRPEGREASQG